MNETFKVVYPLEQHLPSDVVKLAQLKHFSNKAIGETSIVMRYFLQMKTLNKDNYFVVFNTLLEIEDITNILPYKDLIQRNVHIIKNKSGIYKINLSETTRRQFEKVLCPYFDNVIILPSNVVPYISVNKSCVDLLLDPSFPEMQIATVTDMKENEVQFERDEARRKTVDVNVAHDLIFQPSRIPELYQYKALELFQSSSYIKRYLFPCVTPIRKPLSTANDITLQLINAEIANNPEQLAAVQTIVSGTNKAGPFIVFGPPGTGKTTTIVEAILQVRLKQPHSHILVCAGSNSACDTIAIRLCQYYKAQVDVTSVTNVTNVTTFKEQRDLIRLYGMSILRKGVHTVDATLHEYSNLNNFADGNYYLPAVEDLREYGILITTLCMAGKLVSGNIGDDFFTHVFIDEAAASTEPECLVGLMNIKTSNKCSVILSGDHKQLGAVLKSKRAAEIGLGTSLMERLLNRPCYQVHADGSYDQTLQIRLRRNYRSHAAIVQLYNHLYYDNELIAQAPSAATTLSLRNWPISYNKEFPIIFQAVHGQMNTTDSITTSSHNYLEVKVVLLYVKSLLTLETCQLKPSDIGIITPYKLQCEHIKAQLARHKIRGIEVGSVEAYQGREKRIIIVSFVRSFASLGFVAEPRRLNVMLSRPQSLLILIGNPNTLQKNADFNYLIRQCQRHGTFRKASKHIKADLAYNHNDLSSQLASKLKLDDS